MKTKTFDCVEMKRVGGLMIHERLKGMNVEEQIAYWRRRSEDFRREQERLLSPGAKMAEDTYPQDKPG